MAGNAGAGPFGARAAAALSALYALFAAAWIVLSDRLLSYSVSDPQRLASRELVRALDPKRCDPVLADFRSLHPEYAHLELRDSNGRLVCGDPSRAAHATASVAQFPWFAQALRRGGFNASEAFFGVVAKKWVSLQTYPVAGENETGLLVLPLDLESLRSHAQDLDLSAGTNVAIIDRDGTFLMNLREPQRVGRNYREASSVSAVLGRVSGTGRFEGMDGVERFYSWSELPQAGWHVYAGTPVRGPARCSRTVWI